MIGAGGSPPPPPVGARRGRGGQRGGRGTVLEKAIPSAALVKPRTDYCLLVISADGNDWKREFKGVVLENLPLVVYETGWGQLHVESGVYDGKTRLVCRIIVDGEEVEVVPDFILFRAFPYDLFGVSFRRQVLALHFSGIGAVNTVDSVLRSMDRPVVLSGLLRISERLGADKFPVVPAKYHPNGYSGNKKRLLPLNFPTVIKVGSSYGGYGKIVAHNKGEYDDVASVLALGTEFFTEEPWIEHDYEFRIQVIGGYVRCFRRNSNNNWKNQCGNVTFTDHPWLKKYEQWVDEVRQMCGGMDMFGIDVLHLSSSSPPPNDEGEDFILEVNDYAMGFDNDYEPEDKKWVRELVLQRMQEKLFGAPRKDYLGQFIPSQYKRGDLRGVDYLE